MDYLWVAVGGGLGAVTRYGVGLWVVGRLGAGFPFHTLLINVTGSFLIGLLLTLLAARSIVDPAWRLFLIVGFLGGYTTFSSFTIETLALVKGVDVFPAALYVLASNGLGLLAAMLGIMLARALGAIGT